MSLVSGALAWFLWLAIIVAVVWWALSRVNRRLNVARAQREAQALAQATQALERWRQRAGAHVNAASNNTDETAP